MPPKRQSATPVGNGSVDELRSSTAPIADTPKHHNTLKPYVASHKYTNIAVNTPSCFIGTMRCNISIRNLLFAFSVLELQYWPPIVLFHDAWLAMLDNQMDQHDLKTFLSPCCEKSWTVTLRGPRLNSGSVVIATSTLDSPTKASRTSNWRT